jgi:hypothetical protein
LFLAYEDEPTAERAKRSVHRVLSQTKLNTQLQFHLWQLDELGDAEQRERAMQEAAEADVLLVSLHSENRLTPEADATLKQWVGLERSKPCALVISLDPDAKPLAETNRSLMELRAAAARNGITVMLQFAEPLLSGLETVFADIRHRANATSPVLDGIMNRIDSNQHWGLNE